MRYIMKTYQKMLKEIRNYVPTTPLEVEDQKLILDYIKAYGKKTYSRNSLAAHMTASAIVVNQTHDKVLFAYHLIYQSYGWLGGHADGEANLLQVAIREAQEETGVQNIKVLSEDIFSLEILTVDGHEKRGKYVPSHLHLNVTYLLEADEEEVLRIKPDENSGVKWFTPDEALKACSEPWMIERVYRKLINKLQ